MNKIVIFKEFGQYKFTGYDNYYAFVRNAFKIVDCKNFDNYEDVKQMLIQHGYNEQDIINETGE